MEPPLDQRDFKSFKLYFFKNKIFNYFQKIHTSPRRHPPKLKVGPKSSKIRART